jgi:cobalt-zinc-cadmium efflux system membrane fusion protein
MKRILHDKILVVLILVFFTACNRKQADTADIPMTNKLTVNEVQLKSEQAKAIGLATGYITQRNLKTALKVNGKLMLPPHNQATVSLLMGGVVENILVAEGQLVTQGQVLATIQNSEFVQLQQDYLQSTATLKFLKADYERQKELQEENINAAKVFQKAELDYQYETSNNNGIKQKLKLYNVNAEKLTPGNINSTFNVIAPIPGNIHNINVNIGKFAEQNMELFEIVDNRFLHIDLTIFEKDISKIQIGQQLTFTDANDPNHIHNATIFSFNKAFEKDQQAVIAHAKIEDLNETLLPGMFIEARINVDDSTTSTLPNDAIVSNGDEHFIFVETATNTYKKVQVQVGTIDQGFTEVTPLEAISAQQKVVIKGAYYLLSELTKGEGEHHE